MSDNQSLNNLEEQEINLREELEKYLRYWPWFILGVIFCLILAFLYLKITVRTYDSTASVIIKDEENKAGGAELANFSELGLLGGISTNSIENEIGLLKSRRMMINTIRALQTNVEYYSISSLQEQELYLSSPYQLDLLHLDDRLLSRAAVEHNNEFTIEPSAKDGELRLFFPGTEVSRFVKAGEIINETFGSFVIHDNRSLKDSLPSEEELDKVLVKIQPINDVADNLKSSISINLIDDNATLLQLSLESTVPQKARDILDQLIFEYNKEAIQDKNEVALSTARFIDERLQIISGELDTVEVGLEKFKETNSLTNIEAEASLIIENASEYRQQEQEMETQLSIAQSIREYLVDDVNSGLLPSNVGLKEESVNSQINTYNELILERDRILGGATEINPTVKRLNTQIAQLRESINEGLNRTLSNLRITLNNLRNQTRLIGSKIASVPSQERKFRDISRQQNIKEALYIFLLQKREENSLSLAATAPKAKIVDNAYSSKIPVSPKPKIIIVGALLVGLGIPFLFIYIRNILNNKIERREDIEKITRKIPIVGELPRIAKGESDLIEENDRSVLAESFRIMTTNLQYLLVNAKNEGKGYCIYTTSTVKGEGKTFTSINLAMTLANTGKKVILIGADLRNPQLQRYDTDSKSAIGVSDYLVNEDHRLESLIHDSKFHPNLKLFLSGSIPPNPSELLRQTKFGRMIQELRVQYDYVIVDTAPSMLVADTFLISKYADLILYVTRAGYTEKKLLNFAVDAQNDGKLHDVSFVINDVKTANFGYGNKYGYAYGQSKPSLWERFKKSF